MNHQEDHRSPGALLDRLRDATNGHDLDAIVACFAPDYRNDSPVHPERSFIGNDQVRRNWEMILSAVPDITTEIKGRAVDGEVVWSEWEHRGTRPDGSPHVMRGVIVFGVEDGLAAWARFYLEPVQQGEGGHNEFIPRRLGSRP